MSGDEHRQPGPILGQIPHLPRSVQMHGSPSCTCLFCWDEIKRLRAEVERLRAAGDALVKWLWRGGGDLDNMIAAVSAWEEARRG